MVKRLAVLTVILALTAGCGSVGYIKTKLGSVFGVKDAGKPALYASSEKGATLPLNPGDKLTTTLVGASMGLPATASSPAVAPQPAKTITEVVLAHPTVLQTTDTQINANTGTVDTSIREHEIDVNASMPLLYAAIASGLAACVFVYLKYPTPAMIAGGAGIIFLISWQATKLPPWFWMLGVVGLAVAVSAYIFHEKGLKNAIADVEAKLK